MLKITRFLKSLNGDYETGYEYMVNIDAIKIKNSFKKHEPSFKKMATKYDFYKKHGFFSSKVVLQKDFTLIDGYTTYLLAKKENIKKIPVYFVD